jgi:hypothetical protein
VTNYTFTESAPKGAVGAIVAFSGLMWTASILQVRYLFNNEGQRFRSIHYHHQLQQFQEMPLGFNAWDGKEDISWDSWETQGKVFLN